MKRILFAISILASCHKANDIATITVAPKNDTDNMSNTRFVQPTPLVYHTESRDVQLLKFPGATVRDVLKSMDAAGFEPAPINYHYWLMKEDHPLFSRALPVLCIHPENSSDDRYAYITLTYQVPKFQVEMVNADSLIAANKATILYLVSKK